MIPVDVRLLVGPGFRLLSRAWTNGNVVHGQMDYPPKGNGLLRLCDHNPNMRFLPGVVTMAVWEKAIGDYCRHSTDKLVFPRLTTMPEVKLLGMVRPGRVELTAILTLNESCGEAACTLATGGRKKADARFNFDLVPYGQYNTTSVGTYIWNPQINRQAGTYQVNFDYTGEEQFLFDAEGISYWLVLEGLNQCAAQIVEGPNIPLTVVTELTGTTFHRPCPPQTVDLETKVDWTNDLRREAIVHAAATCGGEPIVDGDFRMKVLRRRQ